MTRGITSGEYPGRRYRVATFVLLGVLVAVVLLTYRHYGIPFDEATYQVYGEMVVEYFRTGGADRASLDYRNHYFYGSIYEVAAVLWAKAFAGLGLYEARHLLNGLVGVAGVAAVAALGSRCGGAAAGFWSALLLTLMPTWFGHMFFNSKDIPFAVGFVWAMALIMKLIDEMPRPRLSTALLLGLSMGLANAVRVGGFLLWCLLGLSLAMSLARSAVAGRSLARALLSVALSWGVTVAAWPWALQAPFSRPFEALSMFSNFPGLFETVSVRYLADYSAKIPEVVWALVAVGTVMGVMAVARRPSVALTVRGGHLFLLAFATVFPVAWILYKRSSLYDEIRHLLFVQALLAVAAGCAVASITVRLRAWPRWRAVAAGLLVVGLGLTAVDLVRLHPYEYVYFNRLSGGLQAAAAKDLYLDYWGTSLSEGARWLVKRETAAGRGPERPVGVRLIGPWVSAAYYFPSWMRVCDEPKGCDFILAYIRKPSGRAPLPARGERIHVIERDGVPLSDIVVRRGGGG
jgi:hypothetical protein